jgi:hypothetical protein
MRDDLEFVRGLLVALALLFLFWVALVAALTLAQR